MRHIWAVVPFLIITACSPSQEPPAGGVGFGSYEEYLSEQARQEAARKQAIQPGMVVSPESTVSTNVAIGSPTTAVQAAAAPQPAHIPDPGDPAPDDPAQPVVDTLAQNKAGETPIDPDNPNISDEQNFEAVSSRESIESDRERLEKQKAQFQVIEPTDLPKRRGAGGPNIVAFALSTTNAVGQQVYTRGPFRNEKVTTRNCGRYLSPDLAQEAFLAAGGPKRDAKRMDPDGDGFACGWDPAPFRVIRN